MNAVAQLSSKNQTGHPGSSKIIQAPITFGKFLAILETAHQIPWSRNALNRNNLHVTHKNTLFEIVQGELSPDYKHSLFPNQEYFSQGKSHRRLVAIYPINSFDPGVTPEAFDYGLTTILGETLIVPANHAIFAYRNTYINQKIITYLTGNYHDFE